MKKQVYKLDAIPEKEATYIAISSHEKDYFLSWKLNSQLNIDLKKSQDIEVIKKKEEITQSFSVYDFSDENYSTSFKLVANKSENGLLIEDYSNIDYIFKVGGSLSADKKKLLTQKIKETESVITAFEITTKTTKSKNLQLL